MLDKQTRHRIRLARSAVALSTYELTKDGPGASVRDIYNAVTSAEGMLEDALHDVRMAREAIEGLHDPGKNILADIDVEKRLSRLKAREARASVEGCNARCAGCDAYYFETGELDCPYCGCGLCWNI